MVTQVISANVRHRYGRLSLQMQLEGKSSLGVKIIQEKSSCDIVGQEATEQVVSHLGDISNLVFHIPRLLYQ